MNLMHRSRCLCRERSPFGEHRSRSNKGLLSRQCEHSVVDIDNTPVGCSAAGNRRWGASVVGVHQPTPILLLPRNFLSVLHVGLCT